ncbi:MAG: hypothetical protein LBU65_16745 [Planctomycetaceae bacterium]|jgi:hypothetical protein|nr:hypothetical protein [Planctomycetaceae bacterium]
MSDFKTYDHYGLHFHYPTGWELEETPFDSQTGSVQLTSPTNAFWIVTRHPFGTSPDTVAADVLKSIKKDYRDLEYEPVIKTLFGHQLTGYEIHFFYLDLTNTASILCFADETTTHGIFWQCGDQMVVNSGGESPVEIEKVFEAITYSLLKNWKNV